MLSSSAMYSRRSVSHLYRLSAPTRARASVVLDGVGVVGNGVTPLCTSAMLPSLWPVSSIFFSTTKASGDAATSHSPVAAAVQSAIERRQPPWEISRAVTVPCFFGKTQMRIASVALLVSLISLVHFAPASKAVSTQQSSKTSQGKITMSIGRVL